MPAMAPIWSTFLQLSFFASCGLSSKVYQGFNSGNTLTDRTAKNESDFVKEFETMQRLHNSPGTFNSVRLYTNVQANTKNEPLSAIPAALKTNTSILLGIWCSGTTNITNELDALSTAIDQYGTAFAEAVVAISVGSEDLYRLSSIGIAQNAGIGAGPDQIIKFINDARKAIEGTPLAGKPVGHVDTWRSWVNESNAAVIDAVDFIGVDIYPYYENGTNTPFAPNTFDNAVTIFQDRYIQTLRASKGVDVWITETGWPYKGPDWGKAHTGVQYLQHYWREVGCNLFGKVNTWWYTFRDANPDSQQRFSLTPSLSTNASIDLSCPYIETGESPTALRV